MNIKFLYFDGCPNSIQTLRNLKEALNEMNISENYLEIIEVNELKLAEKINFSGSPTILLNGKDIYTDEIPVEVNYACRIYEFNGTKTGVIPKDFIKEKLKKQNQNK
ncbi:MAG: thioredoxin family protein [Spirochaetota bacterium]